MSCSAKLPIYAFFATAFFPKYKALVMVGLYVVGILIGILVALIIRKTLFKGEAVPFVMELPNYRMPALKMYCSYYGKRQRISYSGHLRLSLWQRL